MNAANTCTKCSHATRPLPSDWTTVDFFDKPVIAQGAVFRTSCAAVADDAKPCLRPEPTATPSIPAEIESELFELRNAIGLAAFACEAWRVLEEVDQVAAIRPEVRATLSRLITARSNWRELGNHTADVLNDVRQRMDALLGEGGGV